MAPPLPSRSARTRVLVIRAWRPGYIAPERIPTRRSVSAATLRNAYESPSTPTFFATTPVIKAGRIWCN